MLRWFVVVMLVAGFGAAKRSVGKRLEIRVPTQRPARLKISVQSCGEACKASARLCSLGLGAGVRVCCVWR